MPLPIGGTNITNAQSTQNVVAAGQSNMAYNPLNQTFAPYCHSSVDVFNIAVGGSSLARWERGGDLNPNLISTLKAKRPRVLLWYQGEADGGDLTYGTRFSDWLDHVRVDSGLPMLIIIFAQLGNTSGEDAWAVTKTQQADIHKANTYMITTDDIPKDPDSLHYLTTGGYSIIGQRFAQMFNTL
jgi:hypothetical protein